MIDKYGADTVRLFILFASPPTQALEWSDQGLEGAHRFVNKFYRLVNCYISESKKQAAEQLNPTLLNKEQKEIRKKTHFTLKKVGDDIGRRYSFNTAIAALMELNNSLSRFTDTTPKGMAVKKEAIEIMLKALNPITPHLCHHLWLKIGNTGAMVDALWPKIDVEALTQEEIQLVVQVNGKLRAKIVVPVDAEKKSIEIAVLAEENVVKFSKGKEVKKIIIVPNKLVNVVVR
jgi:leucyl-tRNA synthetase